MFNPLFKYYITIFRIVTIAVLCVLFIRTFVFETGIVNGRSMENTFIDRDTFIVNKFTLLFRPPQRGDIIQFRNEENDRLTIKRIIGLPGDIVNIQSNKVYLVNGENKEELKEQYLKPNTQTLSATRKATVYEKIPDNSYFVMGDNRKRSVDSRVYGPVNRKYINGIVHLPYLTEKSGNKIKITSNN